MDSMGLDSAGWELWQEAGTCRAVSMLHARRYGKLLRIPCLDANNRCTPVDTSHEPLPTAGGVVQEYEPLFPSWPNQMRHVPLYGMVPPQEQNLSPSFSLSRCLSPRFLSVFLCLYLSLSYYPGMQNCSCSRTKPTQARSPRLLTTEPVKLTTPGPQTGHPCAWQNWGLFNIRGLN